MTDFNREYEELVMMEDNSNTMYEGAFDWIADEIAQLERESREDR